MSPNHFSTNGTYIDPTTDPGFKILFGREAHKKQAPEECETDIDKWLYNIKYMNTMTTMPFTVAQAFQRLEKVSRVENLSATERRQYERDLKFFRDYENRMNYAETQGRAQGIAEGRAQGIAEGRAQGITEGRAQGITEGRAEGRAEIVITLRNNGMSESDIAKFTGMAVSDIQKICSNI